MIDKNEIRSGIIIITRGNNSLNGGILLFILGEVA